MTQYEVLEVLQSNPGDNFTIKELTIELYGNADNNNYIRVLVMLNKLYKFFPKEIVKSKIQTEFKPIICYSWIGKRQ